VNDIKAAFLSKVDCNLIIVDWKEGAAELYNIAVANTRLVGSQVNHTSVAFPRASKPFIPKVSGD